MLTSRNVSKYVSKVGHIIATCVKDASLHIMNLCELGGHQKGLSAAGIHVEDMDIFKGKDAPSVSVNTNYLTAWGFDADTTQFGVRAPDPTSKTYSLTSEI